MSVCGTSDWPFCPQEGLSNELCCASTRTCIALAGNTTLLCCPQGADCTLISPIICNLALQRPEPNTDPPEIQSLELRGSLPVCNNGCCPWGYSCVDDHCVMDKDQSKAPRGDDDDGSSSVQTSSATVSSHSPSPTAPSSSSRAPPSTVATTTSLSLSSQGGVEVIPTSQPSQEADPSTATLGIPAIIGIAIGGFLGLLLIVIIWYLARRLQQAKDRAEDGNAAGRKAGQMNTQGASGATREPDPKVPELGNTQVHEMA